MVREAVERGETERSGACDVVQCGGGDGDAHCDGMRGEWGLARIVNPLDFELEEGLENEDCGGGELAGARAGVLIGDVALCGDKCCGELAGVGDVEGGEDSERRRCWCGVSCVSRHCACVRERKGGKKGEIFKFEIMMFLFLFFFW